MSIRPLHDRVVIKRMEEEKTSAGGIIIPDSASEKPATGTVVAVGNGKVNDQGTTIPMAVSVGDTVLFGKFSGTEVKMDDGMVLVMREDEILAVMD